MIAFLVITTIINIALGYALAVYLGSASASSSSEPAVERSRELTSAAAVSLAPEKVVAASLENALSMAAAAALPSAPAPEAAADAVAASQPVQKEPAEEPSQYRTADMDQDLLAGIEEFRNQLAQLKTQNFDEDVPTLAGIGE